MEAREQVREAPRYRAPTAPKIVAAQRRREETTRRLIEHRVVPSELDRFVRGLNVGTESARDHVAGVLFRAGMRTVADVQRRSADELLALPGIGPRSVPVVRELVARCGQAGG